MRFSRMVIALGLFVLGVPLFFAPLAGQQLPQVIEPETIQGDVAPLIVVNDSMLDVVIMAHCADESVAMGEVLMGDMGGTEFPLEALACPTGHFDVTSELGNIVIGWSPLAVVADEIGAIQLCVDDRGVVLVLVGLGAELPAPCPRLPEPTPERIG